MIIVVVVVVSVLVQVFVVQSIQKHFRRLADSHDEPDHYHDVQQNEGEHCYSLWCYVMKV